MTGPGQASAASVSADLAGVDDNGNQLAYRKVAMLYDANLLGLAKDYAFREGSNESSSIFDVVTTLGKLLTRTHTHADGNTLDAWDCIQMIAKWVMKQDPSILNDEPDSVNYGKEPKTP